MANFSDYDFEADYVSYHVYRPMRNIELVINSVRNFTNWEIIVTTFDIIFVYEQCNSLIGLPNLYGVQSDDLGYDLLRSEEAY